MDAFGAEGYNDVSEWLSFLVVSNPFDLGWFGGQGLLALYNIQDFEVDASFIISMLGRHILVMMLYTDAFPG